MWELLKRWDMETFVLLNSMGSERFDPFWVFITQIDSWIFLFILFGILIFHYFRWKRGLVVSGFLILSFMLTYALKFITKLMVERLRPNHEPTLIEQIRVLQFPGDFSFFSGHASVSFAVVTYLVLSLRGYIKWVYLFYLWAILFSLSRIYVGVHYPSDVLIGAAIGIIIGRLLYGLQQNYFNRLALKNKTT